MKIEKFALYYELEKEDLVKVAVKLFIKVGEEEKIAYTTLEIRKDINFYTIVEELLDASKKQFIQILKEEEKNDE
jgi:hypothetical protein